jgi:hypothetical protein
MKDQDEKSEESDEGEDIIDVGDFRHPADATEDSDSLDGLSVPDSPNPPFPEPEAGVPPVSGRANIDGPIIIDDNLVLYREAVSDTGFIFGEELGGMSENFSDVESDGAWDRDPHLFSGAANQRPPSIYWPEIPDISDEERSMDERDRFCISLILGRAHPETSIRRGRNEEMTNSPGLPVNNENIDPAILQMSDTPGNGDTSSPTVIPRRRVRFPAVPAVSIPRDDTDSESSDGERIVFRPRIRPNRVADDRIAEDVAAARTLHMSRRLQDSDPDSSFEQQVAAGNERLEQERQRGRGRGRGRSGRGGRGRGRGGRGGRGNGRGSPS